MATRRAYKFKPSIAHQNNRRSDGVEGQTGHPKNVLRTFQIWLTASLTTHAGTPASVSSRAGGGRQNSTKPGIATPHEKFFSREAAGCPCFRLAVP